MSRVSKIVYATLFMALVLEPHVIKGHISGLNAPYVQSLITMLIFGAAAIVYLLHARDVKNKQRLEEEQVKTMHHLTDLSAELGLANRRLPLLKELTTNMLAKTADTRKQKQTLMQHLLATLVVSLSQSDWGMFRFVDTKQGRTVSEFVFTVKTAPPSSIIGNKTLMKLNREDGIICKEQTAYHVVATTDKIANVQCHYIMPRGQSLEHHSAFIQNVVDQAQVMYKYLYE